MGVGGQCHATAALPPGKTPGTHLTGGWVDLRTVCRKFCPHQDLIPGPSIPLTLLSQYTGQVI